MKRGLLLGGGALFVFVTVAMIMMKILPGPLKDSDYLVVGSVATLVSLLVLFLVLITTSMKSREVFFRRRPKRRT
jgi:Na+/melibiose symporter-like transporter